MLSLPASYLIPSLSLSLSLSNSTYQLHLLEQLDHVRVAPELAQGRGLPRSGGWRRSQQGRREH